MCGAQWPENYYEGNGKPGTDNLILELGDIKTDN